MALPQHSTLYYTFLEGITSVQTYLLCVKYMIGMAVCTMVCIWTESYVKIIVIKFKLAGIQSATSLKATCKNPSPVEKELRKEGLIIQPNQETLIFLFSQPY